jgi:hypothetical protein
MYFKNSAPKTMFNQRSNFTTPLPNNTFRNDTFLSSKLVRRNNMEPHFRDLVLLPAADMKLANVSRTFSFR